MGNDRQADDVAIVINRFFDESRPLSERLEYLKDELYFDAKSGREGRLLAMRNGNLVDGILDHLNNLMKVDYKSFEEIWRNVCKIRFSFYLDAGEACSSCLNKNVGQTIPGNFYMYAMSVWSGESYDSKISFLDYAALNSIYDPAMYRHFVTIPFMLEVVFNNVGMGLLTQKLKDKDGLSLTEVERDEIRYEIYQRKFENVKTYMGRMVNGLSCISESRSWRERHEEFLDILDVFMLNNMGNSDLLSGEEFMIKRGSGAAAGHSQNEVYDIRDVVKCRVRYDNECKDVLGGGVGAAGSGSGLVSRKDKLIEALRVFLDKDILNRILSVKFKKAGLSRDEVKNAKFILNFVREEIDRLKKMCGDDSRDNAKRSSAGNGDDSNDSNSADARFERMYRFYEKQCEMMAEYEDAVKKNGGEGQGMGVISSVSSILAFDMLAKSCRPITSCNFKYIFDDKERVYQDMKLRLANVKEILHSGWKIDEVEKNRKRLPAVRTGLDKIEKNVRELKASIESLENKLSGMDRDSAGDDEKVVELSMLESEIKSRRVLFEQEVEKKERLQKEKENLERELNIKERRIDAMTAEFEEYEKAKVKFARVGKSKLEFLQELEKTLGKCLGLSLQELCQEWRDKSNSMSGSAVSSRPL